MTRFPLQKPNVKKERATERKQIREYRKQQMELCLRLDGKCMNPKHPKVATPFTLHLDAHHILGRDKKGKLDNVKYLITLCRCCHSIVEGGTIDETGREYMIGILKKLKSKKSFRWAGALKELEKK